MRTSGDSVRTDGSKEGTGRRTRVTERCPSPTLPIPAVQAALPAGPALPAPGLSWATCARRRPRRGSSGEGGQGSAVLAGPRSARRCPSPAASLPPEGRGWARPDPAPPPLPAGGGGRWESLCLWLAAPLGAAGRGGRAAPCARRAASGRAEERCGPAGPAQPSERRRAALPAWGTAGRGRAACLSSSCSSCSVSPGVRGGEGGRGCPQVARRGRGNRAEPSRAGPCPRRGRAVRRAGPAAPCGGSLPGIPRNFSGLPGAGWVGAPRREGLWQRRAERGGAAVVAGKDPALGLCWR